MLLLFFTPKPLVGYNAPKERVTLDLSHSPFAILAHDEINRPTVTVVSS